MRQSIPTLALLVAIAITSAACRKNDNAARGDASAPITTTPSSATSTADNPFAPRYAFATTSITYEKSDGTAKELVRIKGTRVRRETLAGMFANGSYTVSDAEREQRVLPADRKVIVFRTPAAHVMAAYAKLSAAEQARVRESLAKIGPDLSLYSERIYTKMADRTFGAIRASCYATKSRLLDDTGEACFYRGVSMARRGTDPFTGKDQEWTATKVVVDEPIDDALFEVPRDFAREPEPADDIWAEVYGKLVERMKSPRFALEHLDRYAPMP